MARYDVVPHRFYFHPETGRKASFYGAHPHFGPGDGGWEVRTEGYSLEITDSRGNVTYHNAPASLEDATRVAAEMNAAAAARVASYEASKPVIEKGEFDGMKGKVCGDYIAVAIKGTSRAQVFNISTGEDWCQLPKGQVNAWLLRNAS